ncbi:MAG: DUF1684 domain-containing protein [Bacteroidetes bacterium]|nr:DUF1684 domain-containing protein [Bacteroidota bacterium]MDA1119177.1 DUF1684 domain-containing protein [Bacteroidota bacterium]
MTKRNIKIIGFSAAVVLLFFIYFSSQNEVDLENYIEIVEAKRTESDGFMRNSDQSPFQDSLKLSYHGLNYFPPNPDYRVQAIIKPVEAAEQLIIPTSDGKKRRYEKFAYAEFKLAGDRHRLLLLKEVGGDDTIFTAFADETSGESTYGGGRYLDLKFKNARQITIDFNFAYNPYCAYNYTFSCPLPPPENILTIPIMAGEKNYD